MKQKILIMVEFSVVILVGVLVQINGKIIYIVNSLSLSLSLSLSFIIKCYYFYFQGRCHFSVITTKTTTTSNLLIIMIFIDPTLIFSKIYYFSASLDIVLR